MRIPVDVALGANPLTRMTAKPHNFSFSFKSHTGGSKAIIAHLGFFFFSSGIMEMKLTPSTGEVQGVQHNDLAYILHEMIIMISFLFCF